jgi:hypothetical protein
MHIKGGYICVHQVLDSAMVLCIKRGTAPYLEEEDGVPVILKNPL